MTQPRVKKIKQQLPDEFVNVMRSLYFRRSVNPHLNALIREAHEAGWGYQALADPLQMTRERTRQMANAAPADLVTNIPIPPVPRHPEPPPKPQPPRLSPEQEQQLRGLASYGHPTGMMNADFPEVRAAVHLTRLLYHYRQRGYQLSYLASVLGVSKNAIRFRLKRHGYGTLPPSMNHRKWTVFGGQGEEKVPPQHRRQSPRSIVA